LRTWEVGAKRTHMDDGLGDPYAAKNNDAQLAADSNRVEVAYEAVRPKICTGVDERENLIHEYEDSRNQQLLQCKNCYRTGYKESNNEMAS